MNHLPDITLLVAVIALALWPLVLLYLRLSSRRQSYQPLPAGPPPVTVHPLPATTTAQRVLQALKDLGCQPETDAEQHLTFKYQGEDFYIATEEETRFLMIWNPWWGSIAADNEALPYLKEIINLTNVNSPVTTVYVTDDEDEKNIGLHAHCHTFLAPEEDDLAEHLRTLLDLFFDTQASIKDSMNQIGSAAAQQQEKERVRIKGFAAYKENTMPIEPQQPASV